MSGIPAWAVPGRRVVCVYEVPDFGPRLKEICEIASVECDSHGCWLFLCGYDGWIPTAPGQKTRHSFLTRNFRPLVEDSEELGIEVQFYRKAGRKSKAPVRESERA